MTAAVVDEELALHAYPRQRTVLALAIVEGRRMILHPAYFAVAAYFVLVMGTGFVNGEDDTRKTVIELVEIFALFLFAMAAIFPASLVATSARRAGAEETFAALPATRRMRTAALLIGGCGPAAIGAIAVVCSWYLRRGLEPGTDVPVLTGVAAASTPLLYLGVVALACAAARWLPWPGVPVAILVALVAWVGRTHESLNAAAVLTAPWIAYPGMDRAHVLVGYSEWWHVGYLAGLVALAATAALWRDDVRRLVGVGVPVALFTALAAWAQLP